MAATSLHESLRHHKKRPHSSLRASHSETRLLLLMSAKADCVPL